MSNANARKGAQFEIDLMAYLRSGGHQVERLPKTGTEDECDLVVCSPVFARGHGAAFEVIEAKNRARLDIPQFLRERDIGVANYAKHRMIDAADVSGIVVIKNRNHSIGKSWVVMTVDDYYGHSHPLKEWL